MAASTSKISGPFKSCFSRNFFSRTPPLSMFYRSFATTNDYKNPSKFYASTLADSITNKRHEKAAATTTAAATATASNQQQQKQQQQAAATLKKQATVAASSSAFLHAKLAALDEKAPLAKVASKKPRLSQRKLRSVLETLPNIWAYTTCESYDFDSLHNFFKNSSSTKYVLAPVGFELSGKIMRLKESAVNNTNEKCSVIPSEGNQIYDNRYSSGEILIFQDGSVVFWDVNDLDRSAFLDSFLPRFEVGSFVDRMSVKNEAEKLTYVYNDEIDVAHFKQHEILHLKSPLSRQDAEENFLAKFAISDAMSRSVKLAIRENALSDFVDGLNPIVENLKRGKIRLKKDELLTKTGQLFALRHDISLDSDLLDNMPDFYWERESLERLYAHTSRVFCIQHRTRVINEKLNYCMQLGERLDTHLNTKHSVRLERIIIFLIAIEVAFEMIPYFGDFVSSIKNNENNMEVVVAKSGSSID